MAPHTAHQQKANYNVMNERCRKLVCVNECVALSTNQQYTLKTQQIREEIPLTLRRTLYLNIITHKDRHTHIHAAVFLFDPRLLQAFLF